MHTLTSISAFPRIFLEIQGNNMFALTTILAIAGIFLAVVGIIGKVKVKEIEIGTESKPARIIVFLFGVILLSGSILLYLNPDWTTPKPPPNDNESTPISSATSSPGPSVSTPANIERKDGVKDVETTCIEDTTKILDKLPKNESALYERGGCFHRRAEHQEKNKDSTRAAEDYSQAIKDYTAVITLDKESFNERADVYQNRGNSYQHRLYDGDMEAAIQDYTKGIELVGIKKAGSTNKLDLLKDRGYAYSDTGQRALMLADFRAICAQGPSSSQCKVVKGETP